MSSITIAVINNSTVCTDVDIQHYTAAIQSQVHEDFAPLWDLDATLQFVPKGGKVPVNAWPCYILDTADVEGALGYHDEASNGKPFGRIFAKTTIADGENVSVTLSHEILEMLADPYVRLTVFIETKNGGRLYAYESADAVEETTYPIDRVLVSNFVTPAWFDPSAIAKGTRYDYLKKVTKPFQILKGGYMSVYDVATHSSWRQIFAEVSHQLAHELVTRYEPKPGSRRDRRNELGKRGIR